MPTLPALHASGSAAALRIRDHLRGLRWGVPYPLRNGILPLLRIRFRDCEAKMNGGYRRAIPYAADDTPDRLWAGSGEVRWLVRDGKPVNRQGQALLQGRRRRHHRARCREALRKPGKPAATRSIRQTERRTRNNAYLMLRPQFKPRAAISPKVSKSDTGEQREALVSRRRSACVSET